MSLYGNLVTSLKALTIPFAEYEWATRPAGDFGTVQMDFEAAALRADDTKVEAAQEGSVDLFCKPPVDSKIAAVENVLKSHCGASWRRNSVQYEHETRLIHYEWVFQLEGD